VSIKENYLPNGAFMPRAFISICGPDRANQLHDATTYLVDLAVAGNDQLNILYDGGSMVGSFMNIGLLIETKTEFGMQHVMNGVRNTLTTRSNTPCFGCQAQFVPSNDLSNSLEPQLLIRLDVTGEDKPSTLKKLAHSFYSFHLLVVTHHGRHINDNCYKATFTLTLAPGRLTMEDWRAFIDQLKRSGLDIHSFSIEFNMNGRDLILPGIELAPIGG
jgi:hypothetical protein